MDYYHISQVSSNSKVGPLLTTTNSRSSCPDTCRLKGSNGCYGENYPIMHHWNKVSRGERGHDLETHKDLLIKYLAKGDLWRSCQVGDMPHEQGKVKPDYIDMLIEVKKQTRSLPIIYTHHELNKHNLRQFKRLRTAGVIVNISCETPDRAKQAIKAGLEAVLVLPSSDHHGPASFKRHGLDITICPATRRDHGPGSTCARCGLCARQRNTPGTARVIGFPAHGPKKKTVDRLLLTLEVKQ